MRRGSALAAALLPALLPPRAEGAPWAGAGSRLRPDGSAQRATVLYGDAAFAGAGPTVRPVARVVSNATAGIPGRTTWELSIELGGTAATAYTIYGDADSPMIMPQTWKCDCAPFGSDVGGTNPLFWPYHPDAQWDSWLTVGVTDGNAKGDVAAIGLNFTAWPLREFDSDNGAVFWMDPGNPSAPSGKAVVAQLTLPSSDDLYASISVQGKSRCPPGQHCADWHAESVIFTECVVGGKVSSSNTCECHDALKALWCAPPNPRAARRPARAAPSLRRLRVRTARTRRTICTPASAASGTTLSRPRRRAADLPTSPTTAKADENAAGTGRGSVTVNQAEALLSQLSLAHNTGAPPPTIAQSDAHPPSRAPMNATIARYTRKHQCVLGVNMK